MPTFLVSVIISVFNVEPYLREALESVINQTYENLEIIVINDGSTDQSGIICDEYALKDSRIRVIHQDNKGVSAARNIGLDVMNGDLVVFLDSDDAYCPEYIYSLLETMIQDDADIVICKYTSYKETGKLNPDNKQSFGPTIGHCTINRTNALQALARNEINVSVWNKIYKRELWNNIRFPEGHVYEDVYATYLVFNTSQRISIIDNVLYMHRQRAGSITHINTWTNLSDKILANSHLDEFIEKNTPTIFSSDDLKQRVQINLNNNLFLYARYKNKNNAVAVELRNYLIKRGQEIGLDTLGNRSKIAYFMLCHCPRLLEIAYSLYSPVRYLTYRIRG